ncbi:hypothetical protein LINGRAHAP2_LOCUS8051 [Linum grandiflorum]
MPLISDCKRQCELLVETYRTDWAERGCTVMADGWTDKRGRTLINFLVYCSRGLCFLKSVDASKVTKDAANLFKLFDEVLLWIGTDNVVQVVTANAANYKACGKVIHKTYPHIHWTPCAAYCLNLILKDFASLDHIAKLFDKASKITVFVYNHQKILNWLKERPNWKEIVRPGATRFATHFITLNSVYEHKLDLQSLVVSEFFNSDEAGKSKKGQNVSAIILDAHFWYECLEVVKVATPVINLLRIVDSDERPTLGYVYEGMRKVIQGIKAIYNDIEAMYKPYIDIMNKEWNKHFRGDLHVAAYYFNPALRYATKENVRPYLLNLFEKKQICSDPMAAIKEMEIYEEAKRSFGRELAIRGRSEFNPDVWWNTFGDSAPLLKKVTLHLLSQTSSSFGCERNWSVFECIHTKRRNKLEHQRLSDLVFINYNLKLKNRAHYKVIKTSGDPFDYEWISNTNFWVMEDLTPELDYDDLMQAIHTDTEMFETNEGPSTSKKRHCSSADGGSNDGITLSESSNIGDGDTDDDFNDGQENIFY